MTTLLDTTDRNTGDREPSDREVLDAAARLETAPASGVIRWAVDNFHPHLCLTASMTDAVLIDLATKVEPAIEVVFIDTGYHFPETLEMVELVRRRYGLNLRVMTALPQEEELWKVDPGELLLGHQDGPTRPGARGQAGLDERGAAQRCPDPGRHPGGAPRHAGPGEDQPHRHLVGLRRGRLHRRP